MWGGFGIGVGLMALGVVLWTVAPKDKEYFEKKNGAVPSESPSWTEASLSPSAGGFRT